MASGTVIDRSVQWRR